MSLQLLESLSFLKSSRFIFQLLTVPKFISEGMKGTGNGAGSLRIVNDDLSQTTITDASLSSKTVPGILSYMPVLCESFEFPGQTITASDFRMPGRLKIKVPTIREINEIQATFLYPTEVPMYELFSSWIMNMSLVSSKTRYYNDVVAEAKLMQYDEKSSVGANDWGTPFMTLNLNRIYPLSINSLQSNWSDDGFHRINVSFFIEDFSIDTQQSESRSKAPENGFEAELIRNLGRRPTFSSESDRSNFASNINFKFP
jgi:hypothetical protein